MSWKSRGGTLSWPILISFFDKLLEKREYTKISLRPPSSGARTEPWNIPIRSLGNGNQTPVHVSDECGIIKCHSRVEVFLEHSAVQSASIQWTFSSPGCAHSMIIQQSKMCPFNEYSVVQGVPIQWAFSSLRCARSTAAFFKVDGRR
jgi:hypothetical protein